MRVYCDFEIDVLLFLAYFLGGADDADTGSDDLPDRQLVLNSTSFMLVICMFMIVFGFYAVDFWDCFWF